jgi:hypothetical protein
LNDIPVSPQVYVTHVNVDTTLYVVTGLFVVVLIVLITQNLAIDILWETSIDNPAISTGMCMFASLCLLLCSCILPGVFNGVGPGLFVPISTLLDWYFFYTIIAYMSLYFFIWVFMTGYQMLHHYNANIIIGWYGYTSTVIHPTADESRVAQLHSVNFMVCALLLSIFSTHGTIETVLTTPLLFVFMFRTMFKSYAIENSFTVIGMSETYTQVVFEPLLIAFDIVVIGSIHVVGTQALAETIIHANTSFAMMFFIAHTLAYEGNRSRRKCTTTLNGP